MKRLKFYLGIYQNLNSRGGSPEVFIPNDDKKTTKTSAFRCKHTKFTRMETLEKETFNVNKGTYS